MNKKKELPYFRIKNGSELAYGGSQDWFSTQMMIDGGCASITSLDSAVYFKKYTAIKKLYPYDTEHITREDYMRFAEMCVQKYLYPRSMGVNTLEMFIGAFRDFMRERGETHLDLQPFHGEHSAAEAREVVLHQIDAGYPIPVLTLLHKAPAMHFYVWHWYLITGYEAFDTSTAVKLVTYAHYRWMDLETLWHTGYKEKGGFILFSLKNEQ